MEDSKGFSIKKFYISKKAVIWSTLATFCSFAVYVVLLIAIQSIISAQQIVPYGLYVARDISLVVFTILLTSIFTSWLIDTRSKNELYHDTIFDDVISNPTFFRCFADETKQNFLERLEQELIFSNSSIIQNMYKSIQKKLLDATTVDYYFSECNYHLSCKIDDTSIQKKINRTIRLRPYGDTCTIHNLQVLKWSGLEAFDDYFILDSISINGEPVKGYKTDSVRDRISLDSFCGYVVTHYYSLVGPIVLQADLDTIVSISYTTRVPLSDNVYTCRSSVPCKRFSVYAYLEESPAYKINGVAFGFLDVAARSPVPLSDNEIRIEFDDWIFNKDGVVISFAPRNTTEETQLHPADEQTENS